MLRAQAVPREYIFLIRSNRVFKKTSRNKEVSGSFSRNICIKFTLHPPDVLELFSEFHREIPQCFPPQLTLYLGKRDYVDNVKIVEKVGRFLPSRRKNVT